MRFRALEQEVWEIGQEVVGTVRFRDRDQQEVRVNGTVVRIDGGDISAHLRTGVPLRIIIEEQRYLREHHRGLAW